MNVWRRAGPNPKLTAPTRPVHAVPVMNMNSHQRFISTTASSMKRHQSTMKTDTRTTQNHRENVASLHTIAWVNFLETHSKKLDFSKVKNILIKGPYQIHYIDNSIPELFTLAKQWIKQRRGRRV